MPGTFWLVLCLAATGCIRRSLTIRTDPPGALVYVNDQFKGESPLTYDFLWYGGHRVLLRKEGYERLDDHRELRAPAHLWIPFDLAMELLPFPIRDERTWSYTLTPASTPPAPTPPSPIPPPAQSPEATTPTPPQEPSDGPR
ncbi:MAG: PEGA domain-containing protein [Candidatus Omnitrophica bacterium]|nr:PEGA domain-containing protein [Candidatus Omnitrophota bacterium]